MSITGHGPAGPGARNGLPEAWGYSIDRSPGRLADEAREAEVEDLVAAAKAKAAARHPGKVSPLAPARQQAGNRPAGHHPACPPAPVQTPEVLTEQAAESCAEPGTGTQVEAALGEVLDEAAAICPIPDDSIRCRRKGCGYKILYCQCPRGPLL